MAEIRVNVSANKSKSVSVSSANVGTEITASSDTGKFWAQTAKNWAVSDFIVDNDDYSSKYYANKSKESANTAKGYLDSTTAIHNNFASDASSSINELTELKETGIQEINEAVVSGKEEINSAKTTIINDIEFVADGEKKEIEDLADLIKENAEEIASRTSFAMFDTILKDHILTYEESKGLALQGTWVYKDAVAGSRYGYPDFYNKVIEEFNEATLTETVNNVTVKVHSNGHKFYEIADKEGIDSFFNTMGTAWFYGIDFENKRIFLPRNNYFEQVTGDFSEVGQSVEAGLPNITGTFNRTALAYSADGCFTATSAGAQGFGSSKYDTATIDMDASRSNQIYGNSDTVQPNAVKKLLYICVGNTVAQSTVTDVVDVTTTKNDTTPLFTGMYFDFTPNNVSWVKGNRTVSGGVYTFTYNELVNELTTPKYSLKVIETKDMIAGIDYSEYWKINQDEMTFTTPTAISNKALSGAVGGDGNGLGFTDGTNEGVLVNGYASGGTSYSYYINEDVAPIGTQNSSAPSLIANSVVGVTTDTTKSGIIAEQSTAQLYFKVANAVQNLEMLNVGRVMEEAVLRSSLVEAQVVIETYQNGSSGYRIWSDGYCEQWGITGNGANQVITLLKPYISNDYVILVGQYYSAGTDMLGTVKPDSKTQTGFTITGHANVSFNWQTSGYIK